jgi:hypothetical protein
MNSASAATDGSDTTAAAVALLAALRTGNCSANELPTLDMMGLPADEARPLVGVLCPARLVNVARRSGVDELSQWATWSRLRPALLAQSHHARVSYDMDDAQRRITFWDNQTALAAPVRARGVTSQGYRKVVSSPLAGFLRRALSPHEQRGKKARVAPSPGSDGGSGDGGGDDGGGGGGTSAPSASGPFVRYGASLSAFSAVLGQKLGIREGDAQHSGSGREAGRLAVLSPATATEETRIGLWISAAGVTSTWHYDRWVCSRTAGSANAAPSLARAPSDRLAPRLAVQRACPLAAPAHASRLPAARRTTAIRC